MNKSMIIGISGVIVFVIICICSVSWFIGVKNTEIALSNRYDAQQNVVETTIDTMRKTIMNQTKCTREWAEKFIEVVAKQSEGRQGGGMFKATAESSALGLNPDLYRQLNNSIAGKLEEFKRAQDMLTDIWQTHKTFCQSMPACLIVGNKIKVKPTMITSDVTKEAIKSGKLDDDLMK